MEKKLTMSDNTRSDLWGGGEGHWSIPKFSTSRSEEKLSKREWERAARELEGQQQMRPLKDR